MMRHTAIGIGLSLIVVGTQGVAHAVSCGDTVTGTVIMAAPLDCPAGHGLLVGPGATLDCAGHSISGRHQSGQYGIYLRDIGDAVVRNCTVQSFEVGIRLRGTTNASVQNSAAEANTRYGLEITGNSTGARIQGNTIAYNGDEGIHVSGPTDRDALHHIAGNMVEGNAKEGIYLFDSDANTVADNYVQNHAAAGIYVTRSNRNVIEGNTLLNDPIQLADGSQLNMLRDNTIVGQRIKFDSASHNDVHNMSVTGQGGTPSQAYDFYRSSNNTILDSEAIRPGSYHIKAVSGSKNNTFTRLSATPTLRCSIDRTSQVIVTDQNGNRLRCGKS